MSEGPFYGKYRAIVTMNIDPMQVGRIQVMCPDVSGFIPTTWAMPCVPVAGINMGIFTVPPMGSGVWIDFERGDPDFPIWVGGYWGWRGSRHQWVPGSYERPRPGYRYEPHRWENNRGRWHLRAGGWFRL